MKATHKRVLYLSSKLTGIDLTQDKFFPFLNSPLIQSEAASQISVAGIQGICNFQNIRDFIPHKAPTQQFVFFGRSNVGKSTLINKLIGRDFVQVSKKPGKTKQLAFLKIKSTLPTLLVDAPGYGYASDASKRQILQWGKLIEFYLKHSTKDANMQIILLLIDVVHGVKDTDGMLIKMLDSLKKSFMIILTKCDRGNSKQIENTVSTCQQIQKKFSTMNNFVHLTSSVDDEGINQLRSHLLYKIASRQVLTRNQRSVKK